MTDRLGSSFLFGLPNSIIKLFKIIEQIEFRCILENASVYDELCDNYKNVLK